MVWLAGIWCMPIYAVAQVLLGLIAINNADYWSACLCKLIPCVALYSARNSHYIAYFTFSVFVFLTFTLVWLWRDCGWRDQYAWNASEKSVKKVVIHRGYEWHVFWAEQCENNIKYVRVSMRIYIRVLDCDTVFAHWWHAGTHEYNGLIEAPASQSSAFVMFGCVDSYTATYALGCSRTHVCRNWTARRRSKFRRCLKWLTAFCLSTTRVGSTIYRQSAKTGERTSHISGTSASASSRPDISQPSWPRHCMAVIYLLVNSASICFTKCLCVSVVMHTFTCV